MQSRVDRWALDLYIAYDKYEFHKAFKLIYEFCNVDISAFYAKAIKDRLYCELPNSPKRRASQTVCFRTLARLIELTAPILVFTAEEAWAAVRQLPGCQNLDPSIHLRTVDVLTDYSNRHQWPTNANVSQESISDLESDFALEKFANVAKDLGQLLQDVSQSPLVQLATITKHWDILMPLIEKGNKQLDDLKRSIGLGNPLDAEAIIILPKIEDDVSKLLADYGPEIEDALGVGFHRIEQGEIWDIKIVDTREKYPSCARSWKRRPDVGSDKAYPDLSARDAQVVRSLRG
jgi:isoleucyl-tRNA synthetase